ncbi:hypothetical protein SMD44_p10211 (plasmid) [Streptomyces alboflavus]|uniref:Uncharacterized protein n=1 Tax=Streptomyces alboflavus TaxID=67267 RepID=A0A291W340_9ACTN|nr:hypothetical protein [Streptomyces alboflavus]ATM24710.1 hypothetical protein SMD44_p10211 [Streptomyces alboflavus]
MPITTLDEAVEAGRAFDARTGPLATLAAGTVPQCFGRLREYLADLRIGALTTMAQLSSDDPDDPSEALGRQEMDEILSEVAELRAWAAPQQCQATVCEGRADRLLRSLLSGQQIAVELSYRPTDRRPKRRPIALRAGYSAPAANGTRPPYALIDHRNSIDHAVQIHRGWRARLIIGEVATMVYASPGYPETPVSHYQDDTRACVAAVVPALQQA